MAVNLNAVAQAAAAAPTLLEGDTVLLSVTLAGALRITSAGSTSDVNLLQVGGATITLGQKAMAASLPVVIASDQSTIVISAASLPLPSGAATAANQLPAGHNVTVIAPLPSLVAGTANIGDVDVLTVPAPLNVSGGGTEAAALRVTIASDSTGVLSVDDNAGSLTVDIGAIAAGIEIPNIPVIVGAVSTDGTVRTIQFVAVNATADGDNTIIAAVGGQQVYVISYVLTMTGKGNFLLQDTAGTPVVHGRLRSGGDGGGAAFNGTVQAPAFVTAVGTGLEINNASGQDTLGHVTYMQF